MIILTLALAVGVVGVAVQRRRASTAAPSAPAGSTRARPGHQDDLLVTAEDLAELEMSFATAEQEFGHDVGVLLAARLKPMVVRGVPVRSVRSAGVIGSCRVIFADGTVVRARGAKNGDMGLFATALVTTTFSLTEVKSVGDQTELTFAPRGHKGTRQSFHAYAIGLDQPI